MTIKILLSPLLLVALLLETITLGTANNVGANERQYYETRICANCDYNYALATAAEIKPAINCTGGDDPFNSDTAQAQQCFATPIKILVVDANSRNIWHFESIYINQGQPQHKLTNEVIYHSLIPARASTLVNKLLDIYDEIDELALEYNDRWNAGEFDEMVNANNMARSAQTQTDSCDAYEYSDALDAAFSGKIKATMQISMQDKVFVSSTKLGGLSDINLDIMSFNISNSNTSVGGIWQVSRDSKQIKRKYGSDSLSLRNQVSFAVLVDEDGHWLKLHDGLTYFSGISLKNLKAQSNPATLINECLGKALDTAFPKVVASSGNSKPAMGNVASVGDGDGTTTCKHTYYIHGNELMSFEGSCP